MNAPWRSINVTCRATHSRHTSMSTDSLYTPTSPGVSVEVRPSIRSTLRLVSIKSPHDGAQGGGVFSFICSLTHSKKTHRNPLEGGQDTDLNVRGVTSGTPIPTRRRADIVRTPVKQPQLGAPRWSSPHTPTNSVNRGTELASPDGGNKCAGTYIEPLLETTQRPRILSPNSESRATYCLRRSISKPHPPGPDVGRDDANHCPAYSPIDTGTGIPIIARPSASIIAREAPITTSSEEATRQRGTTSSPNCGHVVKPEHLGGSTSEPFPRHCACALRAGCYFFRVK
ncbi:hypothetical protein BHM03_00046380 [Ensete ventricosum]|nr:hypothetical protein BHM03_00046380 [Ensete ventricosum]